jgi:hypothetical protein
VIEKSSPPPFDCPSCRVRGELDNCGVYYNRVSLIKAMKADAYVFHERIVLDIHHGKITAYLDKMEEGVVIMRCDYLNVNCEHYFAPAGFKYPSYSDINRAMKNIKRFADEELQAHHVYIKNHVEQPWSNPNRLHYPNVLGNLSGKL